MVMQRVHFIDPRSLWVGAGWLNTEALAVVRPVKVHVSEALCAACAGKVRAPRCLAVHLVDGARLLVLGDGRHGDEADVRRARALLKAKARCDEQGHKAGDYVTATGLALVPSPPAGP